MAYKLKKELSSDECDLAMYLHIAAMGWCNENLTDGIIPKETIPDLVFTRKTKKLAGFLVKIGEWEEKNGDFFIKNYGEEQETKAEIKQKREQNAERQRRYREKQKQEDVSNQAKNVGTNLSNVTHTNASRNALVTKGVTPSNTDTDTDTDIDIDTDKKKNKKEKGPKQKHVAVVELCDHLAEHIALNTDRRPSVGEQWLVEMDRLIRLDGRDPELILQVIDWCQADEFWRGNILSSKKLREKFDQLLVRMRSAGSQQTASSSTGGPSWQRGMLSHGRMTAEQERRLHERDREKLEEVAATATEEEIRSLLDPAAPQNVVSLRPAEGRKEEVGR